MGDIIAYIVVVLVLIMMGWAFIRTLKKGGGSHQCCCGLDSKTCIPTDKGAADIVKRHDTASKSDPQNNNCPGNCSSCKQFP